MAQREVIAAVVFAALVLLLVFSASGPHRRAARDHDHTTMLTFREGRLERWRDEGRDAGREGAQGADVGAAEQEESTELQNQRNDVDDEEATLQPDPAIVQYLSDPLPVVPSVEQNRANHDSSGTKVPPPPSRPSGAGVAAAPRPPARTSAPATSASRPARDRVDPLEAAMQRYSQLHAEQLRAFERDGGGRFVIMWLFGGLGNRLLPSMTGFLMALLTDRALLVNWKPHESSRRLGEMFDMSLFNWDLQSFPALAERYNEPYCKTFPRDVYYIPEGDDVFAPYRDALVCADVRQLWAPYPVVAQTACQYTLPLLLANPHLQDRLRELGIDQGADTFGRLARYLFRPAPGIQREVDRFYEARMAPAVRGGAPLVGVQFRARNPYIQVDTESMLRCVEQVMGVGGAAAEARVFVATDDAGVRAQARARWGDRVLFNELPLEEYAKENNQHNALMDLLLLARCDRIITTSMSTYGYLGRAFHGLSPERHDVYLLRGQQCLRSLSVQPCLQFCDFKPNYRLDGAPCRARLNVTDALQWQMSVPEPYC